MTTPQQKEHYELLNLRQRIKEQREQIGKLQEALLRARQERDAIRRELCAAFEANCKECSYVNAGDCIGDINKAAAEVIKELIADRDAWAEKWAEEHNARLRAEENAADFKTVRNELCLRCGKYKEAHNGACKGCRWEDK